MQWKGTTKAEGVIRAQAGAAAVVVWRGMPTAIAQDRNRAQLEREHRRRRARPC